MEKNEFRTGVFVSYSHADRAWLARLQVHLTPYLRGEKLELWDDTKIVPGTTWAAEIRMAMARARVAVLLVSPEFLASKYIAEVEMPSILERAANGLTVLWVPIRPSAYDATPLRNIQAAHDPSKPLSTLPKAKQDEALVAIAKQVAAAADVNAVANALRIIDDFEPQVNAFIQGSAEPEGPVVHSLRAEQIHQTIRLVDPGGEREIITAHDLENLDTDAQKLIRAYERTMKKLFERWTELKPKRYAEDSDIRREAREESDEIRRDLCGELNALLGFIESFGKSLQDHYSHVRYICSQPRV